jgi:putative hydroxymethylpyrimidine transport system permease protein
MTGALGRGLLATMVALSLWQFVVWAGDMKHFILPGPLRVAEAFWANRLLIWENALVTFAEIGIGLVLGVLLGPPVRSSSPALLPPKRSYVQF